MDEDEAYASTVQDALSRTETSTAATAANEAIDGEDKKDRAIVY